MKITLLADDRLRLEEDGGALSIEAASDGVAYSAFHMMAGGLATCTLSVMHSWASAAGLDANGLAIEIGWSFADEPKRVGRYQIAIHWPGLAPNRLAAAQRVADQCTVKTTFKHPPDISTEVLTSPPEASAA